VLAAAKGEQTPGYPPELAVKRVTEATRISGDLVANLFQVKNGDYLKIANCLDIAGKSIYSIPA
jgi:hypothetical protein